MMDIKLDCPECGKKKFELLLKESEGADFGGVILTCVHCKSELIILANDPHGMYCLRKSALEKK